MNLNESHLSARLKLAYKDKVNREGDNNDASSSGMTSTSITSSEKLDEIAQHESKLLHDLIQNDVLSTTSLTGFHSNGKCFHIDPSKTVLGQTAIVPIGPNVNCGSSYGYELSFGHSLTTTTGTGTGNWKNTNSGFTIAKVAAGHTRLYKHWMPSHGMYWKDLLNTIHFTTGGGSGSRSSRNWQGFVWHQGESDCFFEEGGEDTSLTYGTNLTEFMKHVREEMYDAASSSSTTTKWTKPNDIPIAIIQIGSWPPSPNPQKERIKQAQQEFCDTDPNAVLVKIDDLCPFEYLDAVALLIVGKRIQEAFGDLLTTSDPSSSSFSSRSSSSPPEQQQQQDSEIATTDQPTQLSTTELTSTSTSLATTTTPPPKEETEEPTVTTTTESPSTSSPTVATTESPSTSSPTTIPPKEETEEPTVIITTTSSPTQNPTTSQPTPNPTVVDTPSPTESSTSISTPEGTDDYDYEENDDGDDDHDDVAEREKEAEEEEKEEEEEAIEKEEEREEREKRIFEDSALIVLIGMIVVGVNVLCGGAWAFRKCQRKITARTMFHYQKGLHKNNKTASSSSSSTITTRRNQQQGDDVFNDEETSGLIMSGGYGHDPLSRPMGGLRY